MLKHSINFHVAHTSLTLSVSQVPDQACSLLLVHISRRQTYIATCVRRVAPEYVPIIESFHGCYPYTGRWHVVARSIASLLPVTPVLKATWSLPHFLGSKRYARPRANLAEGDPEAPPRGAGGDGGGPEFCPKDVSEALCDRTFLARCHAVYALDLAVERFASWSQGCSCHGDEQPWIQQAPQGLPQRLHTVLLQRHYGKTTCPFAGRRACELSSGRVEVVLEQTLRLGLQHALGGLCAGSGAQSDVQVLLSEFSKGKAELIALLSIKLDYWRRLPWSLAAVASPDQSQAQAWPCSEPL